MFSILIAVRPSHIVATISQLPFSDICFHKSSCQGILVRTSNFVKSMLRRAATHDINSKCELFVPHGVLVPEITDFLPFCVFSHFGGRGGGGGNCPIYFL